MPRQGRATSTRRPKVSEAVRLLCGAVFRRGARFEQVSNRVEHLAAPAQRSQQGCLTRERQLATLGGVVPLARQPLRESTGGIGRAE